MFSMPTAKAGSISTAPDGAVAEIIGPGAPPLARDVSDE
jgi:hypothetical protein